MKIQNSILRQFYRWWILSFVALSGCIQPNDFELHNTPASTGTPLAVFTPTPLIVQTYPWLDANPVMYGICFEAAHDAAGRLFILQNAQALENFYNQADQSQLCRQLITRSTFDFGNDRVLAGLWSSGRGCTARHEINGFNRDDTTKRIVIMTTFQTEGDCDYELVRPFWVGIERATDYNIQILVGSD
ncbi:MAG: hypothetical protein J0L63_02805 [Anaerolineae bacterium]|nr:hypothetical protein [Anaerolineae bacterium]MBN8617805.1 hypothetical protein [Anaerolineae bacterium]